MTVQDYSSGKNLGLAVVLTQAGYQVAEVGRRLSNRQVQIKRYVDQPPTEQLADALVNLEGLAAERLRYHIDSYRFGCAGGIGAPGGVTLIGLMGTLTAQEGHVPDSLLLVPIQMDAGSCSAPAGPTCGGLIHLLEGAAELIVAGRSARLLAGDTLRIPPQATIQCSTQETTGMKALMIIPLLGTSWADGRSEGAACFSDALLAAGEPRLMALSSLDILGELAHLTTEGCTLPVAQLTRANFHRNGIIASLLPQYAADPLALRAFVWACNAHPAAPWWLDRTRAQHGIEAMVAELLTR
jgi:hypothetical protein